MLLLEAFAGDLLSIALVIRALTSDTVLEPFAVSDRSSSILLDTRGSSRTWSHRQAGARLSSRASLNIVSSLGHANSRAWLELFNGLPVAKADGCLILI